jgi:multidrug efflux system membrane fusion protein
MVCNKSLPISWIIPFVLFTMPEVAYPAAVIPAITNPSADVTLSFTQPGRIAKIMVKPGDNVKAGELLIQQDDAIEQAQLSQIEALSRNTTQIQASEASLAQKRVDLKKLEKAAAANAATELEVEHAKLEVRIAELSLELAKFENEQNKRKCEETKIRVENMRLKSPIAGTVEKTEKTQIEVGESVNALTDVVRVVQTDPLWVDVPVPLDTAMALKYGQIAVVEFLDSETLRIDGKVTYMAAVADAASSTLTVRVEIPNKAKRPAGEHVKVDFPSGQQ